MKHSSRNPEKQNLAKNKSKFWNLLKTSLEMMPITPNIFSVRDEKLSLYLQLNAVKNLA